MAHQPKGAHWRDLGKGPSVNSADRSTGAILKSLKTPRDPAVVTTHADVQSVNTDTGAAPTQPKLDGGNATVNAAFNDKATTGPKMRPNVVEIPGE